MKIGSGGQIAPGLGLGLRSQAGIGRYGRGPGGRAGGNGVRIGPHTAGGLLPTDVPLKPMGPNGINVGPAKRIDIVKLEKSLDENGYLDYLTNGVETTQNGGSTGGGGGGGQNGGFDIQEDLTDIEAWPWWMWAGIAGGAFLLYQQMKKGK